MVDSAAQGGQIRELKVSGHTMTLDAGLYCVFNSPDGPAASNGLPGVRITVAPARDGHVMVAAFNADGWIGAKDGALVRVTEGHAEVMVTVYQATDSNAEAPKLQVVRLSAEPAAAAGSPALPAPAETRAVAAPEGVEVMAHVYGRGDVAGTLGGWMGEPGSQRWIEGFGIAPAGSVAMADIEYQAVLGRGWLSPWSEGGQFCGSRGMSLPILGLRVRLRGEAAKSHRVELSASFVDGTKIGPVGSGEACEAASLAALEAFQVAFVANGVAKAPKPAAKKAAPVKAAAKVSSKAAAKPAAKVSSKAAAKPAKAPAPAKRRR